MAHCNKSKIMANQGHNARSGVMLNDTLANESRLDTVNAATAHEGEGCTSGAIETHPAPCRTRGRTSGEIGRGRLLELPWWEG